MSRATNLIAALAVAAILAPALVTSAVAIPKNLPGVVVHPPTKMSPTSLTSSECTQLGGTISSEETRFCPSGKRCNTTSSCGSGCVQENWACITKQ